MQPGQRQVSFYALEVGNLLEAWGLEVFPAKIEGFPELRAFSDDPASGCAVQQFELF